MVAGGQHLLQAVPHLVFVVDMTGRNGGKADDGIHRSTDIVRHIGKKRGLCPVCMLRLHQCILKRPGLFPLLLHLVSDIPGHHHHHNIICVIVLRHHKGLPDTHLRLGSFPCPIIYGNLRMPLLKPFPQEFHVDSGVVSLYRLLQHILLPSLKAFRGAAGRPQPGSIKKRDLLPFVYADDILIDPILGQVKFKGTERIRCNGNAVLPLLTVRQGHFFLNAHLFLLQLRDILTDKENLTGSAIPSLQTDNIHMLPLLTAVPQDMAFQKPVILFFHGGCDGIQTDFSGKFLFFTLLDHQRTEVPKQFLIAATHRDAAVLRPGSHKILVGTAFQIHHSITGEQGIYTVNDIPHLTVFPLQLLLFPSRPDHNGYDIDDKQQDQHKFQTDPH